MLWFQIHWIWIQILDFGPIWIRIQIQGLTINCERKNKKNFFRGKYVSLKESIFIKTMITKGILHVKKFLLRWVFELWIYILNLISFAFILYYFYMCGSGSGSVFRIWIWIRIQEAPEYGSNTDPDLQRCLQVTYTVHKSSRYIRHKIQTFWL